MLRRDDLDDAADAAKLLILLLNLAVLRLGVRNDVLLILGVTRIYPEIADSFLVFKSKFLRRAYILTRKLEYLIRCG